MARKLSSLAIMKRYLIFYAIIYSVWSLVSIVHGPISGQGIRKNVFLCNLYILIIQCFQNSYDVNHLSCMFFLCKNIWWNSTNIWSISIFLVDSFLKFLLLIFNIYLLIFYLYFILIIYCRIVRFFLYTLLLIFAILNLINPWTTTYNFISIHKPEIVSLWLSKVN